ncbi:hypothetical protein [Phenylobacterium sp.]|jgi:hypothetical protein|uniref:hypothetical protein n=1 Tax=Phenylobacterium sp. TaxID=1871053 RepID=UPI002F95C9A3
MMAEPSPRSYVLRALAASEIAESCNEMSIRAQFFALAEQWLREAEAAENEGGAGVQPADI